MKLPLIALIASVLIWRGIWNLMDIFLFPGRAALSNTVGLLLGIVLAIISYNEYVLYE